MTIFIDLENHHIETARSARGGEGLRVVRKADGAFFDLSADNGAAYGMLWRYAHRDDLGLKQYAQAWIDSFIADVPEGDLWTLTTKVAA